MRSIILLLIGTMILTGCGSRPVDEAWSMKKNDTVHTKATEEQVQAFFDNPLRNINNFDVNIGNRFFDSVNRLYAVNKSIEAVSKLDICGGDCCTSFLTLTDRQNNSAIHFFKHDCYEYGFSNDQFFLYHDSLVMARQFSFGIKEWTTDSTETLWSIDERIFLFSGNKVHISEREKLVKDYMPQLTFGNMPFTKRTVDSDSLYKARMAELKELLAMESTE